MAERRQRRDRPVLEVQLYWTTWFGLVTLILGPITAYIVTKRICLCLRRKDHELLNHGVETGAIRQLPTGEFIEVTSAMRRAMATGTQDIPPPRSSPDPAAADMEPARCSDESPAASAAPTAAVAAVRMATMGQ